MHSSFVNEFGDNESKQYTYFFTTQRNSQPHKNNVQTVFANLVVERQVDEVGDIGSADHVAHVRQLLRRVGEAGFRIRKCSLRQTQHGGRLAERLFCECLLLLQQTRIRDALNSVQQATRNSAAELSYTKCHVWRVTHGRFT